MGFFYFVLIILVILIFVRSYFNRVDIQRGENIKDGYLKQLNEKNINDPNYYLPYKIRKTIMSEHERLLFDNLRVVLGSDYDVYPQMKLDKIFCIERQRAYKYYLGWLRRINQKSVDFLAVQRDTQSPVFAIELDDSSHEEEERIDRDKFVGELFKRNNFPLIRFNPGQYRVEELKIILDKYLSKF